MSLAKKNRSELLEELETLRARLADLDKSDDKRKRAEDALRESEKRYRNIYEIAPLAFVIWDQECRITDWNERAERMFGWSREEVLGRNFFEFLIPEHARPRVEGIVDALLQGKLPSRSINENLTKNGDILLCEWNNSTRYDREGRVVGATSLALDITERRLAEEALREGERFLSNIFQSIQDGISILDDEMNIIRVNPTMERWYSHMLPLVGKKCHDAYHERNEPCEVCPTRKTLATKEAAYEIVPKRGSGGQIEGWFDLYSFPIFDTETGQLKGVIEYARDITERKQAEDAVREAKDQLEIKVAERTEELRRKNEELESFVYSVSHDLKTPLRAIYVFAQSLKKELGEGLPEESLKNLFGISRTAENMNQLIGDMLAYARLGMQSFTMTDIPLKSMLIDAQFQVIADIERRGAKIHVVEPLPVVRCHERTLAQLLANLLSNAIKFVPKERRPEIEISASRVGKMIRVSVRDNGIGIAPKYRQKIFRMFERLHSRDEYPGTGVGLAIAKKAVDLHGGRMGVESEPGKGTAVWFEIPA